MRTELSSLTLHFSFTQEGVYCASIAVPLSLNHDYAYSSDPHVRDFLKATALKFPPHSNFGKVRGLVNCGSVNNTLRMRVSTRWKKSQRYGQSSPPKPHGFQLLTPPWKYDASLHQQTKAVFNYQKCEKKAIRDCLLAYPCACGPKEMTTHVAYYNTKEALKTPLFDCYFDILSLRNRRNGTTGLSQRV